MSSWCQTTKRLPQHDGMYLVHLLTTDELNMILISSYEKEKGWTMLPEEWRNSVSHWMQMPNPPKMETLLNNN